VLLTVDLFFVAANLTKIFHGASLTLAIALIAFTILMTWQRGQDLVTARRTRAEGPLRGFIDALHGRRPPTRRVDGTAVFLNRNAETTPLAMRACVDHLHTLHEHVVIVTVDTLPVPYVAREERLVVDDLGFTDDGITHVGARFGYMDRPDIPDVLRQVSLAGIECPLEVDDASYFVSRIELERGDDGDMSSWRKGLFLATARLTTDVADFFGLPRERTVVIGSKIAV
jgi:KUP system potassium uptake protein